MENGSFIDGLPIKNGDFPWVFNFPHGYRIHKKRRLLGAVVAARKCRPSGAQPQTTQHLSGGLLISFFKGRIYGP